jgi:endonuclease G
MRIFALLSFALVINSCGTHKAIVKKPTPQKSVTQNKIIELDHQYFRIGYDPKLRMAHYVVYQLSAEQLSGKKFKRKNRFRPDPLLVKQGLPYVESSEYAHTGYDRGHLAPAADFAWSEQASNETFVMSNMAPQTKNLNQDAWKKLESKVRRWACGEKKITVITGPLLEERRGKLVSGLLVPKSFYKVIIDETPPKKALSFIYHQEDKGDLIQQRMVSLNKVNTQVQLISHFIPRELLSSRNIASLKEWKEADCSKR